MRIILKKSTTKKVLDCVDWFSCFHIGSNDREMVCMFKKRREIISWMTGKLFTSQKGLSSMQTVKTSPSTIDFKRSYLLYSIFCYSYNPSKCFVLPTFNSLYMIMILIQCTLLHVSQYTRNSETETLQFDGLMVKWCFKIFVLPLYP